MTKRDLLLALENYSDDVDIMLAPDTGEPATQHPILSLSYATGRGMGEEGGCAVLILYNPDDSSAAPSAEDEDLLDNLSCPNCGKPILECPKCGEEL